MLYVFAICVEESLLRLRALSKLYYLGNLLCNVKLIITSLIDALKGPITRNPTGNLNNQVSLGREFGSRGQKDLYETVVVTW